MQFKNCLLLSLLFHGALGAAVYGVMTLAAQETVFSAGGKGMTVTLVSAAFDSNTSSQPTIEKQSLVIDQVQKAEQPIIKTTFKKKIAAQTAVVTQKSKPSSEPVQMGSANDGGFGDGVGKGIDQGGEISRPEIVKAPKPYYPYAARRAGFEGKVVLNVVVGEDGTVKDAVVNQTSGRSDCDTSARETLLTDWSFKPALKDGTPVEAREKVAIVYKLEGIS